MNPTVITMTAEVVVRLIDAIVGILGKEQTKALLSDDAVHRANALADYMEALKFGPTPTVSL